MRKLIFILLCTIPFNSNSQISYGGTPLSFSKAFSKSIPVHKTTSIDIEALKNEDAVTDNYKDIAWRFGVAIPVNLTLNNSGVWETLNNGDRVWRLKIEVPNAKSININYNNFHLADGSSFFVYNKSETLGSFNEKSNRSNGEFATSLLKGNQVILEYHEPASEIGNGSIELTSVVHGYRDLYKQLKTFQQSGGCNVNAVCDTPIWDDQIRSTVMILTAGNTRFCSGALVNNTLQDGTPYVLTANHCGIASNNIFMFNYQSPSCTPDVDGPTNQTINGCTTLSNNTNLDFYLVRLTSAPPSSFNAFYSGWSNLNVPPTEGTGIHHPRGDVKKISHDDDQLVTSGYYSVGTDYWEVLNWNSGTTEGGSSGSPLFDQNHRIVGQLRGGDANCSNDAFDYYGKFAVSWDADADSTKQLKHWLDPNNSGATIIEGFDPNGAAFNDDATALSVSGIPSNVCSDSLFPVVIIRNKGNTALTSLDVVYSLDGNGPTTFNWTGNLVTQSTASISLPPVSIASGNHNFTFYTSNPNGNLDQFLLNDTLSTDFTSNDAPLFATLDLTTDNFGSETSWIVTDNTTNAIVLEGGGYPNNPGGQSIAENLCLYEACFTFELRDSQNDGYCCAFGTGNMLLTEDATGDTLAVENTNSFTSNMVSFSFCMGNAVGIDELNVTTVNIYPNPNNGVFNVNLSESFLKESVTINVYDLLGKLVYSLGNVSQKETVINLGNQVSGLHVVTISTGKEKIVQKILID